MSSVNRKKNNITNRNRKKNANISSKLGLNTLSKNFPDVAKMGSSVQKNLVSVSNNKYFLYVMLFLGISTILGFLSVRNFNAVILFFVMHYIIKNMGIIMRVALILSHIISVQSTIEGMKNEKKDENGKKEKKSKNGKNGKKDSDDKKSKNGKKDDDTEDKEENDDDHDESDKKAMSKQSGTDRLVKEVAKNMKPTEKSGMAPIDYKMSKDVEVEEDDDEDMIDIKSTQQAAYENLNKIIGDKGFAKMTQDTEKLMSQQQNLAKAMESIGPLVQNAEKMMQGLNLDKFSGMLDKLNGMMGSGGGAIKGASQ